MEGLRVRMSTLSRAKFMEQKFDFPLVETAVSDCWSDAHAITPTPRYDRRTIAPEKTLVGPAIIEDAWSTVILPPKWNLFADKFGNLHLKEDYE